VDIFIISYVIIGYFWSLMCENRSNELNYPKSISKFIVSLAFNSVFWPLSMVMGYRLEQRLSKQKTNNWR